MAVALEWVSRITTVALEMVLPGVFGIWIDGKTGIPLVFTLLGFGLGGSLAMWHLLSMTRLPDKKNGSRLPSSGPRSSHPRSADGNQHDQKPRDRRVDEK